MKIIDAFTFYNNVDILKMRLQLHFDHVDEFYICESDHTYSGRPKEFILEQHLHEINPWIDKVRYIKYHADPSGLDFSQEFKDEILNLSNPGWIMEFRQRNQLKEHIQDFGDNDVIAICDIDEFISHDVFNYIRQNGLGPDELRLNLVMHHYYMNCIQPGRIWTQPFMCKGSRFRQIDDVSFHRHCVGMYHWWPNAGWHFSNLGGYEAIMDKMLATCHTEFITNGVNDPEYIKNCMKYGILPNIKKPTPSLATCELAFVKLDAYPPYLRKIMLDNPKYIVTDLTV